MKILHIVSFNIPFPPDNGGFIDVFSKIKALHSLGISIILHCFEYDRPRNKKLEEFCREVHYYKREGGLSFVLKPEPYIVCTRNSKDLLQNLLANNYPILFEGLHCCYFLGHSVLQNRLKIVRSHNIEHDYYLGLSKAEKNFFKKMFFLAESRKLKRYEPMYKHAQSILAISPNDHQYLNKQYFKSYLIPAFHLNDTVNCKEGKGEFVLYHGSLSVAENNQAALWLVNEVFHQIPFQVKIAGNHASPELRNSIKKYSNIELIENTYTEEIQQLVQDAHINILPTFQATGIKLKLLMALFNGRFCIANDEMVKNTGLENECIVANSSIEMQQAIQQLFAREFSTSEIVRRKENLMKSFSNVENAKKIDSLIFGNQ